MYCMLHIRSVEYREERAEQKKGIPTTFIRRNRWRVNELWRKKIDCSALLFFFLHPRRPLPSRVRQISCHLRQPIISSVTNASASVLAVNDAWRMSVQSWISVSLVSAVIWLLNDYPIYFELRFLAKVSVHNFVGNWLSSSSTLSRTHCEHFPLRSTQVGMFPSLTLVFFT